LRQNATHVQEEEVEEGRNLERYERQMERGSEWMKRESDRSLLKTSRRKTEAREGDRWSVSEGGGLTMELV